MNSDECFANTDVVDIRNEINTILQQVHIRTLNEFKVVRSHGNRASGFSWQCIKMRKKPVAENTLLKIYPV